MKKAWMNISRFHFILFKLKISGEIVTIPDFYIVCILLSQFLCYLDFFFTQAFWKALELTMETKTYWRKYRRQKIQDYHVF